MTFGGLGHRRRSFRRGQSLVLFGLAILVIVAAAIGPLFERSVEQAAVRSTLSSADRVSRGISLQVGPDVTADRAPLAGRAAALFKPGVHTLEVPAVAFMGLSGASTTLVYRDGQCTHLHLAAGRCPQGVGEVLLSVPTAAVLHLGVGGRLRVRLPDSESATLAFQDSVRVVGLYRPFDENDDYWFGAHYSSTAGIAQNHDGKVVDALFGSDEYLLDVTRRLARLGQDAYVRSYINFALIPDRVRVDDLSVLRRALNTTTLPGSSEMVQVQSALSEYLDDVEAGRRAARTVVIPEAISLVLLAGIAFGVVVAAAADQRRPELALARLRGYGVRAAARVFVRELGTLTLAALVPGVLLAWLLGDVASRVWLVPGATPELRLPVVGAVVGAAVLMFVIVAVIGRRTSGQQITDMLRQLPARASRRGLGLTEAMLVVAAIAGLVATINGGKHTVFAALTPTFLAVVIGMATSRAVVAGARGFGRRSLWRGRLARSYAALNIGRRPGSRLTITVLCVATALLVFAGQQWSVAAVNRHQRALAETGAPVTLDVSTPTVARLVQAVQRGGAGFATPVVEIDPPGVGAVPTVAVDPSSFGQIASWGRGSLRPSASTLAAIRLPTNAPPVAFSGEKLHVRVGSSSYSLLDTSVPLNKQELDLLMDFRRSDGQAVQADFGSLSRVGFEPTTLTSTVACEDGCHLTGIEISRPVIQQGAIDGEFVLDGLSVDPISGGAATPLSLGRAADWATTTPRSQIFGLSKVTSMDAKDGTGGLTFDVTDDGAGTSMQYLDLPIATPVLLAGPKPNSVDALGYTTGAGLDGGTARVEVVGTVPFVPEAGGSALIEDLNVAVRSATILDVTAQASVWLRSADPTRERRLTQVLAAAGIHVTARHTASSAEKASADSAPGWSARFALVVGVLAEILAIVLLVLVLLSSRRVRERDLAALRLTGLPVSLTRRSTALELVVIVVTGVVTGAVSGVAGAALSMSAIPLFTAAATVPLPATYGLQPVWLAGVVGLSLILLVPMGSALGSWIARRARPEHAVGEAS